MATLLRRATSFAFALTATTCVMSLPAAAPAAALPAGFQETAVLSGFKDPTTVRFASDGRVFVAEKSGLIKVFDNLADTTPTTFADLRTNVHNFWDRGLLDLELHPDFPAKPYVYIFYVHDAAIGGTAPRWGTVGGTSDGCPTPPGATADGCVVSSRLSRLQAAGNAMTGNEQVLIEDWCQQFPSHAGSGMDFGADGMLYVSAGEGAAFNYTDYGQDGDPPNPCGDPPVGVGGTQTPPTAEGGRLRSQDLRTSGDPVTLDGSLIRVDPDTGAAPLTNPLATHADANARRIVAHGLRNPHRLTVRPGTNEVWIGDVGGSKWEEINRVTDAAAPVENFGWPCYEGGIDGSGITTSLRHSGFDALNLNICENLYTESGAVTSPYFTYAHDAPVVPGESCPAADSSAVTGVAFSPQSGSRYPASYRGALFFADYSRDCIWVLFPGANGLPDGNNRLTFQPGAANPVDLQIGPGGDLFYVDYTGGTIRRIGYTGSSNQAPTALAQADPQNGPAPLTVELDGSLSSDPDAGDSLTYAWDLDGDGAYDDSTSSTPTHTYTAPGNHTARLRVTDSTGATDTDSVVISVDNSPPTASIDVPPATTAWKVDDVIDFSGSATDQDDGSLPASALSWSLLLHHCPGQCHVHTVQDYSGVASGSFTAPDHEYPSHLELRLTATDSGGLTDTQSVRLDPKTVPLSFESSPAGLDLAVGETSSTTPFVRDVIVGSRNSLSAPLSQMLNGTTYGFASWSDGGTRSHDVIAPGTPTTYTANYAVETRTFKATGDARVEEAKADTNYGLATTLKAQGGADPDVDSYLRFAVQDGSGPVESAKLRVYATSATANGPAAFLTSTGWSETAITWANRPARASGAHDDKRAIAAGSWVEYDVSPLVTGNGSYSFVLGSTSRDSVDFRSRNSSDVARRPQLVVKFRGPASSMSETLTASADGRVEEASPDQNNGSLTQLRADGGADPDVESYLRFPAKSISGTVESAKLRVYVPSGTSNGTADGPAAFQTSWTGLESALTWSNRPARSSGATDDKGALPAGAWVEYDVSAITTGGGPYSFVLATDKRDGVNFDSREATQKPELVLTVRP